MIRTSHTTVRIASWRGWSGILAVSLLLPGSELRAGVPAPHPVGSGPVPSVFPGGQQELLEGEALRFAGAWVDGDTRTLEAMLDPDGIRLHIQGDLYPSVDLHRAAGALKAFLEKFDGGEAELMRVSHTPGAVPTGFADLQWRTQVAGTGEVVIFTLFVAFAANDGAWTVTEIRVLP
ncbi:MAG: hypothetical protein ACWGSQ_15155 [Longimicrobiales bacterium]